MQSQYDPRGRVRQGLTASSWSWFVEASAVWLEKALWSDPKYFSDVAQAHIGYLLLRGLQIQPEWMSAVKARRHGYGASTFLQSIAPASPGIAPAAVGKVQAQMAVPNTGLLYDSSLYTPIEALASVFGNLGPLWLDYTDKWMQTSIPNDGIPSATLILGAYPDYDMQAVQTVILRPPAAGTYVLSRSSSLRTTACCLSRRRYVRGRRW